jgi:NADPH:quinone reductase-like Zn-dependent oxidoreductase
VNVRTEPVRERILDLTAGRGADASCNPVGGELFDVALRAIAPLGRILVIGWIAAGRFSPHIQRRVGYRPRIRRARLRLTSSAGLDVASARSHRISDVHRHGTLAPVNRADRACCDVPRVALAYLSLALEQARAACRQHTPWSEPPSVASAGRRL